MTRAQHFPSDISSAIQRDKILGVRAGTEPHRFIGIWAVVVEGRVFVRSWSLKPRSWYRTFLVEPEGAIRVGERELRVRAVPTRSERLKRAVDRAYLAKYNTPGAVKYARDLRRARSRATTTELVPLGDRSWPRRKRPLIQLLIMLASIVAIPERLPAQASGAAPRWLSAEETHCDTTQRQPTDSVYAFDQVDEQVKPTHLTIEDMPLRPAWTTAVLKELPLARYRPARLGGRTVRQLVYQIFTYNEDGRLLHGR